MTGGPDLHVALNPVFAAEAVAAAVGPGRAVGTRGSARCAGRLGRRQRDDAAGCPGQATGEYQPEPDADRHVDVEDCGVDVRERDERSAMLNAATRPTSTATTSAPTIRPVDQEVTSDDAATPRTRALPAA